MDRNIHVFRYESTSNKNCAKLEAQRNYQLWYLLRKTRLYFWFKSRIPYWAIIQGCQTTLTVYDHKFANLNFNNVTSKFGKWVFSEEQDSKLYCKYVNVTQEALLSYKCKESLILEKRLFFGLFQNRVYPPPLFRQNLEKNNRF